VSWQALHSHGGLGQLFDARISIDEFISLDHRMIIGDDGGSEVDLADMK
jgi:hypothetical protein